jgi:hypothetical protein
MFDDPMAAQPSAKKKMKIDTRGKNGSDDKSNKGRKFSCLEAFETHMQPIAAAIAETSQKLADSNKKSVELKRNAEVRKHIKFLLEIGQEEAAEKLKLQLLQRLLGLDEKKPTIQFDSASSSLKTAKSDITMSEIAANALDFETPLKMPPGSGADGAPTTSGKRHPGASR